MNLSLQCLRAANKLNINCQNGLFLKKLKTAKIVSFNNFFDNSPSLPTKGDAVCLALKAAHSTSDALKIIGIHGKHMNLEHVNQSLRTLRDLELSGRERAKSSVNDVLNSDEFHTLCYRLKKHLPVMETNELLDALKTVTLFKVPHDSKVTMHLLHLLKEDINSFNITQIVFLSFLLSHYPKNAVVDALKIALPVVFEVQLKTKLDRTNVQQLTDALYFCAKNNINPEITDYVVKAFHDLDQLDWVTMDHKKAKMIAIALAKLKRESKIYEAVYRDALEICSRNFNKLTFNEVDALLSSIVFGSKKVPYLLNVSFFEKAANEAIVSKWNLLECSIIIRKINNVGVVHRPLLDYMADKILDEPEAFREGKYATIKTFVSGLSTANYKTDHWKVLKDLLPSSTCFYNIQPKEPWIPLCLELASLDVFVDKLLAQVFSTSFLEGYLSRDYNTIDYLQLLRLFQAVKVMHPMYSGPMPNQRYVTIAAELNGANVTEFPLLPYLNSAFGANRVLTRCKTNLGHFIDHVLVILPNGDIVSYNEAISARANDYIYLDQTISHLSPDFHRVAISVCPASSYNSLKQLRGVPLMNQRILEMMGYTTICVSAESWQAMAEWERAPYLLQQVRFRCQNLQLTEACVDN